MVHSIRSSFVCRKLFAICAFLVLVNVTANNAWADKEPIVSLRATANAGGEVEFHIKSVGVGATYVPGFHTVEVTSGSSTVCSAKFDRTFFFARYFFKGPQNSWYLGAATFNEKLASSSDCGEDTLSGVLPMVGYQWMWDSGFNLDLGFRPGILALGFSF